MPARKLIYIVYCKIIAGENRYVHLHHSDQVNKQDQIYTTLLIAVGYIYMIF